MSIGSLSIRARLDFSGRVLDDDPAVGTGEEQDVELAFSGKIVGEQLVEVDSGDHGPTSPVRDVELLVSRVELQLRYRRIARGAQQLRSTSELHADF